MVLKRIHWGIYNPLTGIVLYETEDKNYNILIVVVGTQYVLLFYYFKHKSCSGFHINLFILLGILYFRKNTLTSVKEKKPRQKIEQK
jgi:hypothetical protein